MNRTISFITKMMFAAVTVIMAACSSDDNATQALTVQVKVSMPEGFKSDILYTGHTVTNRESLLRKWLYLFRL